MVSISFLSGFVSFYANPVKAEFGGAASLILSLRRNQAFRLGKSISR
jgi:hypothetical protein